METVNISNELMIEATKVMKQAGEEIDRLRTINTELLAALEDVVNSTIEKRAKLDNGATLLYEECDAVVMEQARAAIARAKGGA